MRLEQELRYYALVETLDGFIGEIINALEKNNLIDNTLIIYASDHGEQIGGKRLMVETNILRRVSKNSIL